MKTFSFFEVRKQWVEAVEYCTSKGLRLATISSVSELKQAQSKVEADVQKRSEDRRIL